ncbi:Retinol dehydrogenase 14 [Podila minutissima]|uniref:Retinol dehydrogenase 14 n=1 Tax=Podila minutissima TaxID=64525 RepID=A0A9P5SL67_9FUNG|nr:Retinol dehydrogenase 14 [Podila minutissima]
MAAESNTVRNYSYDQIPDLTGKYALVTGANQGIGYSTTLGLVSHGAHVTMACRTEAKANEAIEKLHKDVTAKYPHSAAAAQVAKGHRLPLDFLQLDLSDLNKTQKAAQEFLSRGLPLHILINNSGIANESWKLSADGIENHFAVNHLGHFVFTTALVGRLKESQPSRVVVVSSLAYKMLPAEGFDLSTINDSTVGSPLTRYGRSKMANILFANALARRLAGSQVRVNSIHPGVVDTRMARAAMENMEGETAALFAKLPKDSFLTPDDGALTQLYVATSPDVVRSDIRGRFFIPIGQEESLSSEVLDEDLQEKLWEYSEKIVKEKV